MTTQTYVSMLAREKKRKKREGREGRTERAARGEYGGTYPGRWSPAPSTTGDARGATITGTAIETIHADDNRHCAVTNYLENKLQKRGIGRRGYLEKNALRKGTKEMSRIDHFLVLVMGIIAYSEIRIVQRTKARDIRVRIPRVL